MKLLTKEMIESKKDLLLLELENMKKEKCPIKEREYFVQSFLSDIKEIIVSQLENHCYFLDHLSFKQIAATINNIYETDITEDELKKHINNEKGLSRKELTIALEIIRKKVQKLQTIIEDSNNSTFSDVKQARESFLHGE